MFDRLGRRLGEMMIGAIFVKLGYDAAREPGGRVQRAADLGFSEPEMAVRVNGAAMVAGGAALMAGVVPRLAATGLAAALVPTTIAGHAFWRFDGDQRTSQTVQFAKNLGLFGGLVFIAGTPS